MLPRTISGDIGGFDSDDEAKSKSRGKRGSSSSRGAGGSEGSRAPKSGASLLSPRVSGTIPILIMIMIISILQLDYAELQSTSLP